MPAEITFTEDTLRYINLFEQVTKTRVKDCMETEDKLVFVVEPGQANRAVGKGGENVIRLKNQTGKNIQVIEYSDEPEKFIRNVFYNYNVQNVVIENCTFKNAAKPSVFEQVDVVTLKNFRMLPAAPLDND